MSGFHIYCDSKELKKSALKAIEKAMDGFVETDIPLAVEYVFVSEDEIRLLNNEQRKVDKITDVLSFPTLDGVKGKPLKKADHPFEIDENGNLFLGSVAVCIKRAKEQAEEYGHSYERELHYLLIHGTMHLLGYDHEEESEKAEMREKEELILGKLKITRD